MKRMFNSFSIIILLSVIISWSSCTDSFVKSNNEKIGNKTGSIEKNKQPADRVSETLPCNDSVEVVWEFHQYKTVDGKIFGIWPNGNRNISVELLKELKEVWGFNYILHPYVYEEFKYKMKEAAGYSSWEIMIQINDFENFNHQWVIDLYPNVYAYYSDEPNHNNYSFNGIRDYIKINSPGSLFITGEFKPVADFQPYVNEADKVFFTSYYRWYEFFPGIWVDYFKINSDQRANWEYYKNKYGTKSAGNWINVDSDLSEFNDLLGKATNLGLNEVWLYQLEDNTQSKLSTYCEQAWANGFLRKYIQKVTRYYSCIEDNNAVPTEYRNWILLKTTYGEIVEEMH